MRKRRNTKRLTVFCSRAVKVSSKSKCVCNSLVICAEVFGRTIFPLGATGSDGFNESRGDILNVDVALFYEFSEFGVIGLVLPCRSFFGSDSSWHNNCGCEMNSHGASLACSLATQ
jgi:hypothetical protein